MMPGNADKYWWTMFAGGLLPLLALGFDIANHRLGGNPIQAVHIFLGDWALRFVCLGLAITPLQTISKWRGLAAYRQLLGLYAWFYATLHLLAYLAADFALQWGMIGIDILQSPYIWLGLSAYAILLAMGLTSSKWAQKRLGKNWKKLHRLIYLAALAAIVHYLWQLKGNLAEPMLYALVIAILLGFRVLVWLKNRRFNRLMIPVGKRNTLE